MSTSDEEEDTKGNETPKSSPAPFRRDRHSSRWLPYSHVGPASQLSSQSQLSSSQRSRRDPESSLFNDFAHDPGPTETEEADLSGFEFVDNLLGDNSLSESYDLYSYPNQSNSYNNSSHSSSFDSSRPTVSSSIDLTRDSHPAMPSSRGTKRTAPAAPAEQHPFNPNHPSKRRRASNSTPDAAVPRHIEQIDLSGEDDPVASTLQKQRAEQVRSQQTTVETGISKLTSIQCTVCLEPPTNLTATSCGHVFCRACLMDWLVSATADQHRRPNCPACRKPMNPRTNASNKRDVVPLQFMKKKT